MSEHDWHLAQLNIARMRAPIDSPELAGFVAALEPINALAEASAGYVWRLQTEDGDATALRPFDDDMLIVNLTVWESIDSLGDFVFRSGHVDVMRRRREWFERMVEAYLVLWWIPAGVVPTVDEAKERLAHLREHGPSEFAFTFRTAFPPPGSSDPVTASDRWTCPTG